MVGEGGGLISALHGSWYSISNILTYSIVLGMLWAVLTNRTLLWEYWSTNVCYKWNENGKSHICEKWNTVADCDKILARADWIPSYEEWSTKLDLDEPVHLPYRATHPDFVKSSINPWHVGDEKLWGADNRNKYPQQVTVFAMSRRKIDWLDGKMHRKMLESPFSRHTSMRLHSLGIDFMYGMLHRYSFDFAQNSRTGFAGYRQPTAETFTIALHSRHQFVANDGCDIQREVKCLDSLVDLRKRKNQPVQVNIMSDRNCTITKLTEFLESQNISVQVPSHDAGQSFNNEHGPFAGTGFFQDLAHVSQARSAYIGTRRSSSDLLLELIEFNRKMEWWRAGNNLTEIGDIKKCILASLHSEAKQ